MGRRGITVLLGFVVALLLMVPTALMRVPYVVLSPGPTANVMGDYNGTQVIKIDGAPSSDSAGQLRMLTVYENSSVGLLTALRGWWSDSEAVVPRELIYPPDVSQEQVDQQNKQDFSNSQSNAETAALRELGYPVQVVVTDVQAGGASDGKLRKGDIIDSVDGTKVTSSEKLVELIHAEPAGTGRTIGYTRGGVSGTTKITTVPGGGGDDSARIQIAVDQKQPHPFRITISLKDVGGPSAGMMFALGIIDRLTPADLTGGKIIAGTGTIDDEGNVGPIGGLPQKLYGAKNAGATYFLTPADNCAEAKANALAGLRVVKVATLDDALAALTKIRNGGADLPSC